MKEGTSLNWVVIESFHSMADAYIAKGVLETHDIPAVLSNDIISSVYPMTDTWAPIELMVPSGLANEALSLIKNDSQGH